MTPDFEWTDEIENEILERHAEGETIMEICESVRKPEQSALPKKTQVYAYERANTAFRKKMEIAIDQHCRSIFEECKQIADNVTNDWRHRLTKGGQDVLEFNGVYVARAKLMIDTRMKGIAKIRPETYSDKKTAAPPKGAGARKQAEDVPELSDIEIARRAAWLLEKGRRQTAHNGNVVKLPVAQVDDETL